MTCRASGRPPSNDSATSSSPEAGWCSEAGRPRGPGVGIRRAAARGGWVAGPSRRGVTHRGVRGRAGAVRGGPFRAPAAPRALGAMAVAGCASGGRAPSATCVLLRPWSPGGTRLVLRARLGRGPCGRTHQQFVRGTCLGERVELEVVADGPARVAGQVVQDTGARAPRALTSLPGGEWRAPAARGHHAKAARRDGDCGGSAGVRGRRPLVAGGRHADAAGGSGAFGVRRADVPPPAGHQLHA